MNDTIASRLQPPTHTPYPAYKPSGVEWLSKVPESWETKRLKFIFNIVNGSTPDSSNPKYWDGDIFWATPDDLGQLETSIITKTRRMITPEGYKSCGTTLVPAGSLVLSTRAPIGHLAIAGIKLCVNQGCRALVFQQNDSSRYFYYQLLAAKSELNALGRGSTFQELTRPDLADVLLAYPSLTEQRAIAAFLDRETTGIDALIDKKQHLIELLREQRTALISRAVTRGLDPSAPMKDRGIAWVGTMPQHWRMIRLKFLLYSLTNGLFKKREFFGNGVKLVNVSDLYQSNFLVDIEQLDRVEVDQRELKSYAVYSGDIFFVRSSLKLEGVGVAACIVDVPESTVFESHIVRARPDQAQVLPKFLNYYLNSFLIRQRLIALAETTTMTTIAQPKLGSLEVVPPPLSEQHAIVKHIDDRILQIDTLINEVYKGMEKLREYRTALISAAVTGKIDIRDRIEPKLV